MLIPAASDSGISEASKGLDSKAAGATHEDNAAAMRRESIAAMLQNTTGEIRNPLVGLSKAELFSDVERFAQQYDLLDEVELLKKGALVAQNPADFENLQELDEPDRDALRTEITRRWRHPLPLYLTIVLNSIAAAIQGWDQTGSNGANLSWPQAFGIPDSPPDCGPSANAARCQRNTWIVGFVNACPYIAIAFFTGWISDPVNVSTSRGTKANRGC